MEKKLLFENILKIFLKRTFSNSKQEISSPFSMDVGHFCLLGFESGSETEVWLLFLLFGSDTVFLAS
jgi:hypothetical protein